MHRPTLGSYGGAVSYERVTPVILASPGTNSAGISSLSWYKTARVRQLWCGEFMISKYETLTPQTDPEPETLTPKTACEKAYQVER